MFKGKRVQVNVKCIHYKGDGYCSCSKVKGWFFGLGSKMCVSYASPFEEKCPYLKRPLKGIKYKG